jgi:hypothetical protein
MKPKGALAVRKLVVGRWPTTAGTFAFVVFWTDFSAGRKTPLEVTTLFAHTERRAEALAKKLPEENVTKGFERADGPRPPPRRPRRRTRKKRARKPNRPRVKPEPGS